jgi:RNA polymerase sigma-54 factor
VKPALALRLTQHLALTPQLQQSIRLLQLSTVELNQEIDQALADNPLLERDDDPLALAVRVKPDGSIAGTEAPAAAPEADTGESPSAADGEAAAEPGAELSPDWGVRGEGRG